MLRTYSNEEKTLYLEEFREREISQGEFAREKGIPLTTFRGWLARDTSLAFGEIDISNGAKNKDSTAQTKIKEKRPMVFAGSNIRIELREGYDKEFLKNIVEVITSAN